MRCGPGAFFQQPQSLEGPRVLILPLRKVNLMGTSLSLHVLLCHMIQGSYHPSTPHGVLFRGTGGCYSTSAFPVMSQNLLADGLPGGSNASSSCDMVTSQTPSIRGHMFWFAAVHSWWEVCSNKCEHSHTYTHTHRVMAHMVVCTQCF